MCQPVLYQNGGGLTMAQFSGEYDGEYEARLCIFAVPFFAFR
jgi:hypothetical protein